MKNNKKKQRAKKSSKKTKATKKSGPNRKRLTKSLPKTKEVKNKSSVEPIVKKNIVVPVPSKVKKTSQFVKTNNKVKIDSQMDLVMNHLIKNGSINTMEAVTLYGALRLGAIIFKIRQGGMNIKTARHIFVNKNGNRSIVAKYILQ